MGGLMFKGWEAEVEDLAFVEGEGGGVVDLVTSFITWYFHVSLLVRHNKKKTGIVPPSCAIKFLAIPAIHNNKPIHCATYLSSHNCKLVRARTCMPVRAWPYVRGRMCKKKKITQTKLIKIQI